MDCRLAARGDGASTGGSEKQKDKPVIDSIYRIVATWEKNSISCAVRQPFISPASPHTRC